MCQACDAIFIIVSFVIFFFYSIILEDHALHHATVILFQ